MAKSKRGILSSIVNLKCPSCRQEDLFTTPTFSFKKPLDMPDSCPNCSQKFEPEPGYYYGAMFISYIMTGWFSLGLILFFHWVLGWSLGAAFALLIFILLTFFVYINRLSRSIWIHITEKYDPGAAEQQLSKQLEE